MFAALSAFGRVYFGVHHLGDVAAGAAVAFCCTDMLHMAAGPFLVLQFARTYAAFLNVYTDIAFRYVACRDDALPSGVDEAMVEPEAWVKPHNASPMPHLARWPNHRSMRPRR